MNLFKLINQNYTQAREEIFKGGHQLEVIDVGGITLFHYAIAHNDDELRDYLYEKMDFSFIEKCRVSPLEYSLSNLDRFKKTFAFYQEKNLQIKLKLNAGLFQIPTSDTETLFYFLDIFPKYNKPQKEYKETLKNFSQFFKNTDDLFFTHQTGIGEYYIFTPNQKVFKCKRQKDLLNHAGNYVLTKNNTLKLYKTFDFNNTDHFSNYFQTMHSILDVIKHPKTIDELLDELNLFHLVDTQKMMDELVAFKEKEQLSTLVANPQRQQTNPKAKVKI